jgi:hypothetical protein
MRCLVEKTDSLVSTVATVPVNNDARRYNKRRADFPVGPDDNEKQGKSSIFFIGVSAIKDLLRGITGDRYREHEELLAN